MEATFTQLPNSISNHIVVCGIHSSIYHFILPLRACYLKDHQQPIVIISTTDSIPSEIWDAINIFPSIYIVNGSPLNKETLYAANIKTANKAVILGFDSTIKSKKQYDVIEEMMDAQPIFIYKAIKRCNPQVQILTELQYAQNIDFLLPKSQNKLEKTFSTLYAAGEVYLSAIIDTLSA